MFYDRAYEVCSDEDPEDIYTLCGMNADGKILSAVTHYNDDDAIAPKTGTLDFGRSGEYEMYILDQTREVVLLKKTSDLTFDLPVVTSVLIREV